MHILNPNMYEEGCQVSNYIYQTNQFRFKNENWAKLLFLPKK